MKVVVRARAERQISVARGWWLRNRDKAPEAFDEDLAWAKDFISNNPNAVQVINPRRGIRRLKLDRIRYYLYFRIRARHIEVIQFWHTSRRPPRL